jgi:hypothetical protein
VDISRRAPGNKKAICRSAHTYNNNHTRMTSLWALNCLHIKINYSISLGASERVHLSLFLRLIFCPSSKFCSKINCFWVIPGLAAKIYGRLVKTTNNMSKMWTTQRALGNLWIWPMQPHCGQSDTPLIDFRPMQTT